MSYFFFCFSLQVIITRNIIKLFFRVFVAHYIILFFLLLQPQVIITCILMKLFFRLFVALYIILNDFFNTYTGLSLTTNCDRNIVVHKGHQYILTCQCIHLSQNDPQIKGPLGWVPYSKFSTSRLLSSPLLSKTYRATRLCAWQVLYTSILIHIPTNGRGDITTNEEAY